MDDRFLHDARRAPRAEFATGLRARLERTADERPPRVARRWAPVASGFVALAVIAALFTLPSVRASAQAFLDLFRVRNFTAITVDAARMRQLENGSIDLKGLLGDHI